MVSGDWCPVDMCREVRREWPETAMVVMGGATEGAIWSIAHDVDVVPAEWTSIPYGRALANQRVEVIDDADGIRVAGVAGEIVIAGRGVASGYRGDAER